MIILGKNLFQDGDVKFQVYIIPEIWRQRFETLTLTLNFIYKAYLEFDVNVLKNRNNSNPFF